MPLVGERDRGDHRPGRDLLRPDPSALSKGGSVAHIADRAARCRRTWATAVNSHHHGTRAAPGSWIINDVEGTVNQIGTGLVEFVGGVSTAALAFAIMADPQPRA